MAVTGKAPSGRGVADVPPERLAELNAGRVAIATLTEGLAMDFAVLLAAVVPQADATAMQAAAGEGVTRRMALGGTLLRQAGADLAALAGHPSDTVRGWVCYALAQQHGTDLPALLTALRPLADDPHFGVREWVWLAARPALLTDVPQAIALLTPWTADPSEWLRRFASEALRPRGVWCAHAAVLRADPAPGLPLLEPLRADPARYVQDSVANWLNDAAKDHPDWVRALCARWLAESPVAATGYICKRAQRSLKGTA